MARDIIERQEAGFILLMYYLNIVSHGAFFSILYHGKYQHPVYSTIRHPLYVTGSLFGPS